MKELSIEEKAKAYDIALDKIKRLLGTGSNCSREELEYVFPELKESEDERIRENIIATIHLYYGEPLEDEAEEMIAWIEKQGEQKYVNTVEPRFKINDKVIHKETGKIWTIHWYLADTNSYYVIDEEELIHHYSEDVLESAEQKPTWSEEDETKLKSACALIRNTSLNGNEGLVDSTIDWLKSLKDRVQLKQEWSEDDKRKIDRIYFILRQASDTHAFSTTCRLIGDKECVELQDFLKSLRPQNTWKPSEEQIKALDSAIHCYAGISPTNNREVYALEIMKEQLKKLRWE